MSSSHAAVGQKQSSAQCWLRVRLARLFPEGHSQVSGHVCVSVPWAPRKAWPRDEYLVQPSHQLFIPQIHFVSDPREGLRLVWTDAGAELVNGTETKASPV